MVALIALTGAIAPAEAAKKGKKKGPPATKLKTATATGTVVGGSGPASATATCPGRTKAVAGGYSTPGADLVPPGGHYFNVHESQRVGDNAWRVSGSETFGAPASDPFAVFVYCQKLKKAVEIGTATVPLPSAADVGTTVQAACPGGTKLLSGGFEATAETMFGGQYVSRSSDAGAKVWQVDATRLFGFDARTVAAFAYCSKFGKLKRRSGSVPVTGASGPTFTAVSEKCPKKTSALGGGYNTGTPVSGFLFSAVVFGSYRTGKTWTTVATPGGSAVSSSATSQALCRR